MDGADRALNEEETALTCPLDSRFNEDWEV